MIFVDPFTYGRWLSPILVLAICAILFGPFLKGWIDRYRTNGD
jgi:putative tricarboxylic transport membrane protein